MVPLDQNSMAVLKLLIAMVFILREFFYWKERRSGLTLPEEVPNEDTSLYLLTLTAESCDGANIIGYHHERGPGQVFLSCLTGSLLDVHLTEAAGHDVSRQTEPVVVPSVDIFYWKYERIIKLRVNCQ